MQHRNKLVAPDRQSPGHPWPSSRNAAVAARTASCSEVVVNTGGKGATRVPLHLQQTTGAKKYHRSSGVLPQKMHVTNSSYT
jgi:hypothetical protein